MGMVIPRSLTISKSSIRHSPDVPQTVTGVAKYLERAVKGRIDDALSDLLKLHGIVFKEENNSVSSLLKMFETKKHSEKVVCLYYSTVHLVGTSCSSCGVPVKDTIK